MTPANINMWVNDVPFGKHRLTKPQHAMRMCAQVALLGWLRLLSAAFDRAGGGTKQKR